MDTDTKSTTTQARDRDYTLLPTAFIQGKIGPDLSVHACWLYAYLRCIMDYTGRSRQGTRTMAKSCRMSVGMVVKAKQQLADAGLIVVISRPEQSDLIEMVAI